jgi:hypothetical protein
MAVHRVQSVIFLLVLLLAATTASENPQWHQGTLSLTKQAAANAAPCMRPSRIACRINTLRGGGGDTPQETAASAESVIVNATSTESLYASLQYIVETVVATVFAPCMYSSNLTATLVSDEAVARAALDGARERFVAAEQESHELEATWNASKASLTKKEAKIVTLQKEIKGLIAIREIHKANMKPVPPAVLVDLTSAQSNLLVQKASAEAQTKEIEQLHNMLTAALDRVIAARTQRDEAYKVLQRIVPDLDKEQDLNFGDIIDRLKGLKEEAANFSLPVGLAMARNFSKSALAAVKQNAKFIGVIAAPFALAASPLRDPITRALDPHVQALKAKLPDPKLEERLKEIEAKFEHAKSEPLEFAKANIPALGRALAHAGTGVARFACDNLKHFRLPAIGLLFAHDRFVRLCAVAAPLCVLACVACLCPPGSRSCSSCSVVTN